MAQLLPPRVLKINLTRLDPLEAYGEEPYASQAWKFRARFLVEPQLHSDSRTPRSFVYNGLDVIPGDFITTQSSKILKITSIESQTSDQIVCLVQDINRLNSSIDTGQTGESAIETGYGMLFTAPSGLPVLFPLPANFQGIDTLDLIGVIGRFFYSDVGGFVGGVGYTGSIGYTGSRGASATNINVKGHVATSSNLPVSALENDAYFTDDTRELWVWSSTEWFNAGQIVGVQGERGYTGSAGVQGIQGIQGTVGYTGSIGYTGSAGAGYTGSRGPIGYTGSQGEKGDQGLQGLQGLQGFRGYQGSQGVAGFTGSRGIQGASGTSGYTGSVGYTGSQGIPGEAAFMGYTGSQGNIGYTGSRGNTGYTGSQGNTGYTGSQGVAGVQGLSGYTGSRGATGGIGYTGSRGVPGPNGIGDALIDQSAADDGSVLVYKDQVNTWSPTLRLDAQTIEGGFF